MAGLGWCDWVMGLLQVAWDTLFQRVQAVHLPECLPYTPLSHLTCIITGCTSGIGLETAKHLAKSGAHLVLAVRNTNAAKELLEKWRSEQEDRHPPLNAEVIEVDCLSFDSVRKFAEIWEVRKLPLNVLINNAGIFCMAGPHNFSKDGCEQHMQVNHLAPALLSVLLLPSLLRGSPSRVIMVNSVVSSFLLDRDTLLRYIKNMTVPRMDKNVDRILQMHYLGYLDPEDLNLKGGKRKYNSTSGYSDSKLAQILFCHMLQRRLPTEAGIDIIGVHPGEVLTKVTRNLPKVIQFAQKSLFFLLTPIEGARSVLFCSTDKQVQDYARAMRALSYPVAPYFGPHCRPRSMAKQAYDMEKAQQVWQETLKLVGLPLDCIETALSGCGPVNVTEHIKVINSFSEGGGDEAFDFLMENSDNNGSEFFT